MKGISPLVAATLLIVITTMIGIIFNPWIEGFVKNVINFIEASYEQNVVCATGKIVIEEAIYNCRNLNLVIKNNGNIILRNITLFIIYENNTIDSTKIFDEIRSKDRIYASIPASFDYEKLLVKTHCSRTSYEINKVSIVTEC